MAVIASAEHQRLHYEQASLEFRVIQMRINHHIPGFRVKMSKFQQVKVQ